MPITAANGATYTDSQIQAFFAGNPGARAIALQAAALGLGINQIQQALAIAGQNVSTSDISQLASQNGFAWGATGALVATPSSGITVQGTYYTPQQISDFLAQGGDPVQFATAHGLTDTAQITALVAQARATAAAWVAQEVANLTTQQIAALTTAQIGAARTDQIAALATSQITALTTSQIAALRTEQLVALSANQVAALSAEDIAALSPAAVTALGDRLPGAVTQPI